MIVVRNCLLAIACLGCISLAACDMDEYAKAGSNQQQGDWVEVGVSVHQSIP
jgi:hypothetical protein